MRKGYFILTIGILSVLIFPSSVEAQQHAHGSASITVTVLPAVGVEIQERIFQRGETGQSGFVVKVTDKGKYSLLIFNEVNKAATIVKVFEANSAYHLKERELGSKRIVQLAVLSS